MLPKLLTVGVAVVGILVSGCGSASTAPTASTQSSSTTQTTASTTSSATSSSVVPATPVPLRASDQSDTMGTFQCSNVTRTSGSHTNVADVRMGRHDNFDRIVFEFAGPLSAFKVERQANSTFTQDPSGRRVTLDGSAGVRVVLTTASSMTYTGPRDFKPEFPAIREARLVGDFESVTTWGIGLSRPSCLRVFTLASPNRLVIDVQH
jgi:hypothetical protein